MEAKYVNPLEEKYFCNTSKIFLDQVYFSFVWEGTVSCTIVTIPFVAQKTFYQLN